MWLFYDYAIDPEAPRPDLYKFSGQPDDSFDVLTVHTGKPEYDDVETLRGRITVGTRFDERVIPLNERGLHAWSVDGDARSKPPTNESTPESIQQSHGCRSATAVTPL